MALNLGRTETALLTNKSGGALAQGDVVIVDGSNASAVTTTTSSGYISGRVGVVLDPNGIANNSSGIIAFSGYVPVINLSGTGSIGDLVKTHTVAKQGVRHAAPVQAGDFAQVLGTSATPAALLLGSPLQAAFSASAVDVTGTFALSGDISPAQITSNQNDYNPTGLSGASTLRLNSDASRNITGLQGGADGRVLFIHNVGSNSIVLKDDDTNSSAANRFALTADITLSADSVVILQYDSTSSRWRAVAGGGGGSSTSLVSDKKSVASGDKTTTSTTFADIDASLDITLTTGARRCLVIVNAAGKNSTTSFTQLDIEIDGTRQGGSYGLTTVQGGNAGDLSFTYLTDVLTAGSHTFKLFWRVDGGTGTIFCSGNIPIKFSVNELPLKDPS